VNRHLRQALLIVFLLVLFIVPPVMSEGRDKDETQADVATILYPLGLVPSEGDFPTYEAPAAMLGQSLPSRVDFSDLLPPVGNQGSQNSCVGWTLAYYYRSFQEKRSRGWDVTLPQYQFSPAWVYNQRAISSCTLDQGMSYFDGLRILRDKGAASLSAFPYDANDPCKQPSAAVKQEAASFGIVDYQSVFHGVGTANVSVIKNLLARGEPVAIAVPVYASFYNATYQKPLVSRPKPGETYYGGHAMLIVGYDDVVGGFKAVNSWGAGWARDGYCYLAYDFVRHDAWEAWMMLDRPATPAQATYSGSIRSSGINPAAEIEVAAGLQVTAWIGNVQVAATTASWAGNQLVYSLVVPEDNPLTAEREGGVPGDEVRFKVGSYWATGAAQWQRDAVIAHDLNPLTYRHMVVTVRRGAP
jgi:C1A family cysteine protease